ncbi:MAG: hypothetical protein HY721_05160 [Planctomycetes bacterium]|nr:hypothetical protein [Planctomycetota bacterium]
MRVFGAELAEAIRRLRESLPKLSRAEGLSQTAEASTASCTRLFPVKVPSLEGRSTPAMVAQPEADRLLEVLSGDPLEDGVSHPADGILQDLILEKADAVAIWMGALLRRGRDASLVAAMIKCLGRLDPCKVPEWGVPYLEEALRRADIEVRDAAVQALELWATPASFATLRRHRDPVPWLQEYVQRLLREVDDRG